MIFVNGAAHSGQRDSSNAIKKVKERKMKERRKGKRRTSEKGGRRKETPPQELALEKGLSCSRIYICFTRCPLEV